MIIEFDVERAQEGMRLDRCVSENSAISRSRVQELIAQGKVIVNGAGAKSSLRLAEGDHIRIDHDEPAALDVEAQDIPLDVLYEDGELLVVKELDLKIRRKNVPQRVFDIAHEAGLDRIFLEAVAAVQNKGGVLHRHHADLVEPGADGRLRQLLCHVVEHILPDVRQ